MPSPTASHLPTSSVPRVTIWRPWSMPADEIALHRKLCGLLNKVTPRNIARIAHQFAEVTNVMERSGQSSVVRLCATMILERCVLDTLRMGLIAKLVQRAADGAECDSLRWRSVDPYYLEDPATSMPTVLRRALLEDVEAALRDGREGEACALSSFTGELLVLGVLSCDDVQDIVNLLFKGTLKGSDLYSIALCRILRRVVTSTEASHIIDALGLVNQLEDVLAEDTISVKIRYSMMSMLDQSFYPKPTDVFGSDVRRSEAYGFHDEVNALVGFQPDVPSPPIPPSTPSRLVMLECDHSATALFRTRDLSQCEQFFLALPPVGRDELLSRMVSIVMNSGDDSDATLVASFLCMPSIQRINQTSRCATKVLEAEIIMLEDTVLDVPSAYRVMAIMLHASGLPIGVVENLASRIIIDENTARDRLLEEIHALSAYAEDILGQLEPSTDPDASGEESCLTSEYACAY